MASKTPRRSSPFGVTALTSNSRYVKVFLPAIQSRLFYWKAKADDLWNQYIVDGQRRATPVSEHLQKLTFESMQSLTLLRTNFEQQFDRFEYFIGLAELYNSGQGDNRLIRDWGPIGSFDWRNRRSETTLAKEILNEAGVFSAIKRDWPPFKAGFFDGKKECLKETVDRFEHFLARMRSQIGVW